MLPFSCGMVYTAMREGTDGVCLLRVSPSSHLDLSFLYQGVVGAEGMNTVIGLSLGD